jgi:hypothetical protein
VFARRKSFDDESEVEEWTRSCTPTGLQNRDAALRNKHRGAQVLEVSDLARALDGAGRGGRTPTSLPSADFEFPNISVSL